MSGIFVDVFRRGGVRLGFPNPTHECSLMAKMALLSEEFQQDVREVTSTDCTQITKMFILSAGFRQDVREVTRKDCSLMAKMWPFCQKGSYRMSEKSREQTVRMLTSSKVCE